MDPQQLRKTIASARAGDASCFVALLEAYGPRLYGYFLRATGHHHDAEDLLGELTLRLVRQLKTYDERGRFEPWLFRIAANLVMSHRRHSGRLKLWSLDRGDEDDASQAVLASAATLASPDPPPSAAAMAAERQQRVAAALENLPEDMRIVVILRDIEDMDYAEIAEILGTPAGTVKSRLHRARCALKETLADLVG